MYLVRCKEDGEYYALKTIRKLTIQERGFSVHQVLTERNILSACDSPFTIKLFSAFQDSSYFYFCLEYVPAGSLAYYLKKLRKFTLDQTQFFAAQVVLALEYLHETLNIIHRDLKPGNILIDAKGYCKLTDFGLSKSSIASNLSWNRSNLQFLRHQTLLLTRAA